MVLMRKCRWLRPSIYATVLTLALTCACSRRLSLGGSEGTGQSDARDLPFHGDAEAGSPGESASHPAVPDQRENSSALPFNSSSPILPAGTLLTVQLEKPLTISRPDGGRTFLAAIAEPVTVDGRTVIPRDAEVNGRVESARLSNTKHRTGYLRLTLDSIRVGDKLFPLPTSSLFARALISAPDDDPAKAPSLAHPTADRPGTIRLQQGRRFTFRLTAALDLSKSTPLEDKALSGTK